MGPYLGPSTPKNPEKHPFSIYEQKQKNAQNKGVFSVYLSNT